MREIVPHETLLIAGTIRVYCRVRPFLPGQSNRQSTVDYIGETGNIMIVNPFKQGKIPEKFSLLTKCLIPMLPKVHFFSWNRSMQVHCLQSALVNEVQAHSFILSIASHISILKHVSGLAKKNRDLPCQFLIS